MEERKLEIKALVYNSETGLIEGTACFAQYPQNSQYHYEVWVSPSEIASVTYSPPIIEGPNHSLIDADNHRFVSIKTKQGADFAIFGTGYDLDLALRKSRELVNVS